MSSKLEELQRQNEQLLEMLKWNTAAMVAILSEQENGKAFIPQEDLENIDLAKRAVQISIDEEERFYIVEAVDIEL